jgi:hypothetical protein
LFAGEIGRSSLAQGSAGLVLINRLHAYHAPIEGEWRQLVLPGDGMTQVRAVTNEAPFVAAGCSSCSYALVNEEPVALPQTRGAIWTSTDGLTWSLTDLGAGVSLTSVGRGGAGYAALGDTCAEGSVVTEAGGTSCTWERAAWVSADGVAWSRAALVRASFDQVSDVIVTDSGVVFLGYNDASERVTWTSSDGSTWIPADSRFFDVGAEGGFGNGATAFGSSVVQVGHTYMTGHSTPSPISWTYRDGEWTAAPAFDRLARGDLTDVAHIGDELIAIGTRFDGASAVWVSSNSGMWSPVDIPQRLAYTYLVGIEPAGDGTALITDESGTVWSLTLARPGSPLASPSNDPAATPTARPTPRPTAPPTLPPPAELPPYYRPNCRPDIPAGWSIARYWDERVLELIRQSSPNPGVHARNLFHVSAAMWDAWAAYDDVARGYFVTDKHTADDVEVARSAAISYAAYGLLKWRYYELGGIDAASEGLENTLERLCYRTDYESTMDDTPASLGNRIAQAAIKYGRRDGALEADGYVDESYSPLNAHLVVEKSGTVMTGPDHWQPIKFSTVPTDQGGRPLGSPLQRFIGAGWGFVESFALPESAKGVPIDPGPPPRLGDATSGAQLKDDLVTLIRYSAMLEIGTGDTIDISPGALGNNSLGTNDGPGHPMNPATGQPYESDVVLRADFQRALAEFWADGPSSETPPGHWNVIANAVADSPGFERRLGGTGPDMDRLEWDVKMYFALNGAVHDAAIAAWGLKRYYDSARPISQIRYMAGRGQSSDPGLEAYDPLGLPLVAGLIELVTAESSAPGERHEHLRDHVAEVAVRSWRGFPAQPYDQISGAGWVLGVDWVPYQRVGFVTPAFPGYISGHSTFSRAAAEVLTAMTGSEFFPGGLQTWTTRIGELRHELGPTMDITLQWATYYDAADQAGLSRQYMGIHIPADDFVGRRVGAQVGESAWQRAQEFF